MENAAFVSRTCILHTTCAYTTSHIIRLPPYHYVRKYIDIGKQSDSIFGDASIQVSSYRNTFLQESRLNSSYFDKAFLCSPGSCLQRWNLENSIQYSIFCPLSSPHLTWLILWLWGRAVAVVISAYPDSSSVKIFQSTTVSERGLLFPHIGRSCCCWLFIEEGR